MSFCILLVTTMRWPSAPRLAEAFADTACRVEGVFPRGHVLAMSEFLSKGHPYRWLAPLTSIKNAIISARPDLIVSLDDRATSHLHRLWSETAKTEPSIADRIACSLGKIESYPRLFARASFIEDAHRLGIAVPPTIAIEYPGKIDAAIARLGLPVMIKSDGRWGGAGVALAKTKRETGAAYTKLSRPPNRLRSLARAVKRKDVQFLADMISPKTCAISAQKFVPGTAATTALACWRGRLIAANHYDVVAAQQNFGPACVLRHIQCSQMQDAATRLVAHFGLSGLHGLDFMRTETGTPLLIEINPRATQTAHLSFGEQADLVAALVAATGICSAPARPAATQKDVVALFPQEIVRDPHSPWLSEAFHDLPRRDPAVLAAVTRTNSVNARTGLQQQGFRAENCPRRGL